MHVTCRYLRSKLCTSKCRLINNSMKMKNYDRGEAYLPRKKTSASRQRTKLSEDRDRDSVITAINHCDESLLVILPAVPTDLTTSTDNTAIVWQIAFQQRRFVVFLFVKRLVGCKVTVYYTVYVHGTCLLAETPAISSRKKFLLFVCALFEGQLCLSRGYCIWPRRSLAFSVFILPKHFFRDGLMEKYRREDSEHVTGIRWYTDFDDWARDQLKIANSYFFTELFQNVIVQSNLIDKRNENIFCSFFYVNIVANVGVPYLATYPMLFRFL